MKRSGLKKRANISNNPEIIKLYNKNKEIMLLIFVEKLRQNISKSMWRIFYNFLKILKLFFSNKLDTYYWSDKLSVDPLVSAIRKHENQPSISKIKSSIETKQLFDFNFENSDDISKS